MLVAVLLLQVVWAQAAPPMVAQGQTEGGQATPGAGNAEDRGTDPVQVAVALNYTIIPARQCNTVLPRLLAGFAEYHIRNLSTQPVRLRVTTDIAEYSLFPHSEEIRLDPQGEERAVCYLSQTPLLSPRLLEDITEPTDTAAWCRVELLDDEGTTTLLDQKRVVLLLPANVWVPDLLSREEGQDRARGLAGIAAWLQDTPAIREVLASAAQTIPAGASMGYQLTVDTGQDGAQTSEAKSAHVRHQVKAVYDVLQARGVRCWGSLASPYPVEGAVRVLLPDEVLHNRTGNCMELSLLLASVLSGTVETAMVITDAHTYIAWHTWSDEEAPWDALDMGAMGSADFEAACQRARSACPEMARLLDGAGGTLHFSEPWGTLIKPTPAWAGALGIVSLDRAREACLTPAAELIGQDW